MNVFVKHVWSSFFFESSELLKPLAIFANKLRQVLNTSLVKVSFKGLMFESLNNLMF